MSISVPAQAPVRRVRSTGYGNRIGLAVMLAEIFMTVMDNSIVNVAIPSIRSTLGATFAEAELVVASYTFSFAVGLITGGRSGDIFGQRRMFLAGFVAFTLTPRPVRLRAESGYAHRCSTTAGCLGVPPFAAGVLAGAEQLR
jgi:MFS family permease